jgi:ABC-2 type transport system permease protein
MAVTSRAAVRGMTLSDAWRSFRTAIGLGWAVESNWSDPTLFAIYTVAKPLGAALILVLMFQVITGGTQGAFLEFLIVGSALWQVVFGVLNGLVLGVLEDRERYRMIKYVVLTPASIFPFLLGRGLARLIISFLAVGVTLAVGIIFLGVRLDIDLPILLAATAVGLPAVIALGIFMAGWCLQLRQEAWSYPEAIAGSLYLVSGAVFPVDLLPTFLQPVTFAFPTTWWLELSRRGLLGEGAPGLLGTFSDAQVLLFLVVTTAVAIGIALVAFNLFLTRARQLGILDMTTSG